MVDWSVLPFGQGADVRDDEAYDVAAVVLPTASSATAGGTSLI